MVDKDYRRQRNNKAPERPWAKEQEVLMRWITEQLQAEPRPAAKWMRRELTGHLGRFRRAVQKATREEACGRS